VKNDLCLKRVMEADNEEMEAHNLGSLDKDHSSLAVVVNAPERVTLCAVEVDRERLMHLDKGRLHAQESEKIDSI
jgi:hypothetical protein